MRHQATTPEQKLWQKLRDNQINNLKFRRQVPFPPYIVDFYCHAVKLVIELDGDTHVENESYDEQRTQFLEENGLCVIRFTNREIMDNIEGVLEKIINELPVVTPSPQPSPQGRGGNENEGHRARLRTRFLKSPEALPDYEMLELILAMVIPRRDVKPLAKTLIARYGSLAAVLSASLPSLLEVKGLGEGAATALKIIQASASRMMKQELTGTPVLSNWQKLQDYLLAILAHEKIEHFRILFLNKKNHLIADEVQHSGTVDQTAAYPREIVKRALDLGATALILVHNHPSGDSNPSPADIALTRQIVTAAQALGIVVHDHLIVSKGGITSLKNQGFMN